MTSQPQTYCPGEAHGRYPPTMYSQLRQALLDCGPLASDDQLSAVFAHPLLKPWRNSLPQAPNPSARVDAVIAFLVKKRRADTKENALVLLLHVLSQRTDPGDACHQRLADLAGELQRTLGGSAPSSGETSSHPKSPRQPESESGQPSSALEPTTPQPGDLRLLVFDGRTKQWASQCEFSIPPKIPDKKSAYSVGFPLCLVNRGPVTVRDLVIEMVLKSDTDFFLAYKYDRPPLTIEDSPRNWRISSTYDFCEFEGGADFACHSKGRRHLGMVQMLVPYGQPDTTMTFHYRIQTEGYEDRGSFAVVLNEGTG